MARNADTVNSPGEHMARELRWIHGMLRRDLRVLRELAESITLGAPHTSVRGTIRSLRTQSPLWQLRVNCLQYCRIVHTHHGIEDAQLFPALRRSNPALGPVVDRLEADHRRVSDLLDRIEALADVLGEADGLDDAGKRERLVSALGELSTHLLEHLDFEEASIIPELRTWTGRPM